MGLGYFYIIIVICLNLRFKVKCNKYVEIVKFLFLYF